MHILYSLSMGVREVLVGVYIPFLKELYIFSASERRMTATKTLLHNTESRNKYK
jgi:hypothetical protein